MKAFRSIKLLFIVLFSGFIIAISVIAAVIGIQQLSRAVTDTFAEKGIQIVEKAVSLIDGDSFEALAKSLNHNDPYYEETRIKLLQLKEESGCLYLYTMAPKDGTIWRYIIDGSAEPYDKENFSDMGDEEDSSENEAFRRALASGKPEISSLNYQDGWGWLISVYTPIFNSAGSTVGIAACDFDGGYLRSAIRASEIRLAIAGGIFMLAGLILLIFLMRMIFSPINEIKTILKEISVGEGDLTKRINIIRKNEIGELAEYFNKTLDTIMELVVNIKNETEGLKDTGNDLASQMGETAAAINEITSSIMDIKTRFSSQSTYVSETNATMEKVVININKLSGEVKNQSGHISSASSAIEQMVANTRSVTDTLVKNAANAETLISASELGRTGLQEVAADIQEIARESEGLLNINSVMENISSQTNLLSMNAAIEAAHAGEAGKGFSVVAQEIRKLAENSGQQSKTISTVLKKIKSSIDKIRLSTENVLNKFEAIDTNVRVVVQQEENIRYSMEEQQVGSKQILDGISNINEITRQVESGSQNMLEGAREVIMESTNLEHITQEINISISEMASGADHVSEAIEHIKMISGKNREKIAVLADKISRFKVE